jgi:hypothetical protein
MLGNTKGKKTLENGSNTRVGIANETAPRTHSSRTNTIPEQSPTVSLHIKGKLTANRSSTPIQPPGRNKYCPAARNTRVAPNQIPSP